jgi:hypothetical protein
MDYPWYGLVSGNELSQGQILEDFPIYEPSVTVPIAANQPVIIEWRIQDVVIMTQSCDLVQGREKVTTVLLCPLFNVSEISGGFLKTSKGLEDVRRGNIPGIHMIAASEVDGFTREVRIADLKNLYSMPLMFVRHEASLRSKRLTLLPPYREHLAQAFARFYMRVGLPVDIPPFNT